MLLLCLIFLISTILFFTGLIPDIPEEILKGVSGISFAVYAICLLITKEEYRKLYNTRDREFDYVSITMDNLENTLKSRDITIQNRDKEINELNDMIEDYRENVNKKEEEIKKFDNQLHEIIMLMYRAEASGKPVAITPDNSLYYSFEVKKEGGIVVTRKEKNTKLNKTEKVNAKLGIDIDGIVHVFEKGRLIAFDPLNMIQS